METIDAYNQTNSDETLCMLAASGDRIAEEVLVTRYNRLVRVCARPFFLAGGDSEDLIQEGMFGLLKAIREFDPTHDTMFRTFAEICIRSRIRSAIIAASRGKHTPLNDSVSLENPLFDGISSFSGSAQNSPEELIISREESLERLERLNDRLSRFESAVLELYLRGCSYQEIAEQLQRPQKSVDNAVQRIRRKVAQYVNSGVISES